MFKKIFVLFLFLFVVGCAYGKHINRGDELFQSGQYEDALIEYEAAQKIDPESKEAAQKILSTKEKLVSAYTNIARTHLAAEEYFKAIDATKAAYEKLPNNPIVIKLIDDVRDSVFKKADAYVANNNFAMGLKLSDTLVEKLALLKEKAGIKSNSIRNAWVKSLVERAESANADKRKADAVLLYTKAAQLSGDANLAAIASTWKKEVISENLYILRLNGSGSGAKNVDSMVLGTPYLNTTLRIKAGKTKGEEIQGELKYKLASPKFSKNSTSLEKSIRYQSGTKQVDNPFYKTKQDKVVNEERRLVQAEKDLSKAESDVSRYQDAVAKEGPTPNTSTGAEQNLSRAKSSVESRRRSLNSQRDTLQRAKEDLSKTDKTKEEPVYSEHSYTVTTHTLSGTQQLSGLFKSAKNVSFGHLAGTRASDSTHRGHDASKLKADPLQLPGKSSLVPSLYRENASYLLGLGFDNFQKWRKAMLEVGKGAASDNARLNAFAVYILTDPANVDEEVTKEIELFRGIPNVTKLFLDAPKK